MNNYCFVNNIILAKLKKRELVGLNTPTLWSNLKCSCSAAPKRSKKERDRTWEYEEKERRGSGERRRSGHHDGRRSSGSRYRDNSPDDSEEETPPPSMIDSECLTWKDDAYCHKAPLPPIVLRWRN